MAAAPSIAISNLRSTSDRQGFLTKLERAVYAVLCPCQVISEHGLTWDEVRSAIEERQLPVYLITDVLDHLDRGKAEPRQRSTLGGLNRAFVFTPTPDVDWEAVRKSHELEELRAIIGVLGRFDPHGEEHFIQSLRHRFPWMPGQARKWLGISSTPRPVRDGVRGGFELIRVLHLLNPKHARGCREFTKVLWTRKVLGFAPGAAGVFDTYVFFADPAGYMAWAAVVPLPAAERESAQKILRDVFAACGYASETPVGEREDLPEPADHLSRAVLKGALDLARKFAPRLETEVARLLGFLEEPAEKLDVMSPKTAARARGVAEFLRALERTWALKPSEAARAAGLDEHVLPALAAGKKAVTGLQDRRVDALLLIRDGLDSLLQDEREERRWLQSPSAHLGGNAPVALILDDDIASLLAVQDYVDWLNGR